MSYYTNVPRLIREISRRLKMCEEAVWLEPRSLAFVPDRLKRVIEKSYKDKR